jgi:aspartate/methionine/tyrosine aminotransferase
MKKVLFTLAALMMAGSLCAAEYMYIDDFELTQEEATNGVQKMTNVKAHFDAYVSGWQVDMTLPEGVTTQQMIDFCTTAVKDYKVAIVPGSAFSIADTDECRSFRLNFSTPTDANIV